MATGYWEVLVGLVIGLLGGVVGSLLGIGGGALMTPLLLAGGVPIEAAVPASLLAIVGTSLGGLYEYDRRDLVDYELASLLLTAGVAGSIAGVFLAEAQAERVMKPVLAAVLVYTGLDMLRKSMRTGETRGEPRPLWLGWATTILAGVVSSLAGVGGGVLIVPIINRVLGRPIKVAVATSKLMVGVTSGAGAVGYLLIGYMKPCLALSLLAGTLTGGILGSKAGVRASGRTITVLFAAFMIIMSVVVLVRG